MSNESIANAMKRVEAFLTRRPEHGLHDDAPATARWEAGTRVVATHTNGMHVRTDMPVELGGSGDEVTPGWLFRASLASCLATRIAMAAAAERIELTTLEVQAKSRSDTRGLFGMPGEDGQSVCASAREIHLLVRIASAGVSAQELRGLVEQSHGRSPVPVAVGQGVPVTLQVEIDTA